MNPLSRSYDFVVVGAGIVGLTLAAELRKKFPQQTIAVFEKEADLGKHASGRNSGVLHSGIYYSPGSLKARVSVEGRRLMKQYCEEHDLPIHNIGKVILPVRDGDDQQLELLLSRAKANGVQAELLDDKQLAEIEPSAHSRTGKSLFVPEACVVDPKAVLHCIAKELKRQNVDLFFGSRITKVDSTCSNLSANGENVSFGHLYNAAGVYADVVARAFGIAQQYTILPFKGIYYRLSESSGISVKHLIYAVPDLRVPFLGVHFMKTVADEVFLGPTVIPAFGRENYSLFQGLNFFDTGSILLRIAQQYVRNEQGFRMLIHKEGKRFLRRYFAEAAQALVPSIRPRHLLSCDKVGIRAQLLDTTTNQLVMDFLVEKTSNSTHVLNAVSPAFTSSFAFAKLVL